MTTESLRARLRAALERPARPSSDYDLNPDVVLPAGRRLRDAAVLVAAGYTLGSVHVVDQFRWSPHVELVAGFTLTSA